jgi:hypothetical protein
MRFVRSTPKIGGLPELQTFECRASPLTIAPYSGEAMMAAFSLSDNLLNISDEAKPSG